MNDKRETQTIPKLKLGKFDASKTPTYEPANIVEHIIQAQIEAVKRVIKANAVVISDKLYFSKLQISCNDDVPMICGLKCVYSKELPDDTLFAVCYLPNAPQTKDERFKELEAENAKLKEKLQMIADFVEDNI